MKQLIIKFFKTENSAIDIFLLVLYCAFIYWLSSKSRLPAPMLFPHQDKFYHAGAYFVMGALAWRCYKHFVPRLLPLAILSIVFCSLYGLTDEWHQSYVPGRDADFYDWLSDTVGAVIIILILYFSAVSRKKHNRKNTEETVLD